MVGLSDLSAPSAKRIGVFFDNRCGVLGVRGGTIAVRLVRQVRPLKYQCCASVQLGDKAFS